MVGGQPGDNIRQKKARMREKTSVFGVGLEGLERCPLGLVTWNSSATLMRTVWVGVRRMKVCAVNVLAMRKWRWHLQTIFERIYLEGLEGLGRHVEMLCLFYFNEGAAKVGIIY